MIATFKGIERISSAQLDYLVPVSECACVAVNDYVDITPAVGNAYIDLVELDEALAMYFDGSLNAVNTERINYSLRELVPGKPLISQLDADDIEGSIGQLNAGDRQAIESYYLDDRQNVCQNDWASALFLLSEIVLKLL
jgi:hypothetical protein